MDKRLLLASPHMSGEGYELEYINDAFRKNWIAPLGENVNEFEKAMGTYMGKGYRSVCRYGGAASGDDPRGREARRCGVLPEPDLLRFGQPCRLLRREAGVH